MLTYHSSRFIFSLPILLFRLRQFRIKRGRVVFIVCVVCMYAIMRNRSDTYANTGESTIEEYVVQAHTYQIKKEKVREIVSLLIED